MSLVETVTAAQARGARLRPAVGGFPYLAESLRQAGITHIAVTVPSWTTVLTTTTGSVIQQGTPMFEGPLDVPAFDQDAFLEALRADQEGRMAFPDWMEATWRAGVTWYEVDLEAHTCTYRSPSGESYVEDYLAVELPDSA
jgi:uncharacterized protein YbcV (DUF1398 family)